jgi:hypothetical protein
MDTNETKSVATERNKNMAPYYDGLVCLLGDNAMDLDDAYAVADAIVDLMEAYQ